MTSKQTQQSQGLQSRLSQKGQIVIIGAGYAGMIAAVRLARQMKSSGAVITLVNGTEQFVERVRLHQLAANQTFQQHSIPHMLRGTGVKFALGRVTAMHPDQHRITVQTATETHDIGYDYLLYALGSTIESNTIPGVREHAYLLTPTGEMSAIALRDKLVALNVTGGKVLICGGGATGIESAAEFADSFPKLRVQLVTRDGFGTFLNKRIAMYMAHSLQRRGVTIQDQTSITEINANTAITADGERIPFDVCLWAGGFAVSSLARDAGLAVNEQGQILVDPFMRSISYPEIYAAGDAAQPVEAPGVAIRMSAFTAVVTGVHAADCLSAHVRGRVARPLSFAYLGQGIALGRHDAIGFPVYPADVPRRPYFTGHLGYYFREFFVHFLAALPRLEWRIPGAFIVLGKGRYAASKRKDSQPLPIRTQSTQQLRG